MTDFTCFSKEQLVAYIDEHYDQFACERGPDFPGDLSRHVSGSLYHAITHKDGFALLFLGRRPIRMTGDTGANANILYLFVLREHRGKGIGKWLINEAKLAVPSDREIDLNCEGLDRVKRFEKYGFTTVAYHAVTDIYEMRLTPASTCAEA